MKTGIRLAYALAAVLLGAAEYPLQAFAGWSHDPAINTEISVREGADTSPLIVSDGSGGTFISWVDNDIYVQRIDANGNPMWGEGGIAVSSGGAMYSPQLCGDGAEGVYVAWQKGSEGVDGIYVQRIDGAGNALWGEGGEIICNEEGKHLNLRIVSDGIDGAIVTWQDGRNGDDDYDIYAQRIRSDEDGDLEEIWGGNGRPICTATGNQESPQLIADGSGGAIFVWQDGRDGAWDIFAQRVDGDGDLFWAIDGNPVNFSNMDNMVPQLTDDGVGGAIFVWKGGSGEDEGIYAQRFDGDGGPLWNDEWPDNLAVSIGEGGQHKQQIVSDGSGGAIVVWRVSGSQDAIYAQRIDSNGGPLWSANGVNVASSANIDESGYLSLAEDGSNGVVVVWADQRNGLDYSLYSQRIKGADGSALWNADGIPVSTADGDQRFPSLVVDGNGGVVFTWQDKRNGDWDIYAQKVALTDGSLPLSPPTVTTSAVSNITPSSATVGGEVASDGGSDVTARGVCWGESPDPQIGGECISAGSGTGTFAGTISGLTLNTTYHLRAYATNGTGTSYGSDVAFTTINKYSLNVAFAGGAGGTVTWNGTTCSDACTLLVDPETTAQIHAAPSPYYLFSSWSGACSGSSPDCSVVMDAVSKEVTANFTRDTANSVRVLLPTESRYPSIGDAISLDSDGSAVIDTWGWEFTENPTFDRGEFTIKGGWDEGYNSQSGMSTVIGTVTVVSGSLTVDNLTIR